MKYLMTTLLLFILSTSLAMDPPVSLWERQYYPDHDAAKFFDIELTPDGNLFVTGSAYDYTVPLLDGYSAFLFNTDGDLIWDVHHPWYTGRGLDGVVLPDGSFAITGRCVETPDSTYSLFIMKIDQSGTIEWTRIYDYPETREEGYGITCLPDGGFAVCGRVNGIGQWAGEAWLLRIDSQGDTLWTNTWGTDIENWGKVVLYANNELCMLTCGGSDSLSDGVTHLLFFDLAGNYIRGTDYSELVYHFPRGMCLASDGGYTFVTDENPVIWHTDQYGETLWWNSIYNYGLEEGHDVIRTMDSGYLFCGWGGKWQEPSADNDCTHIPTAELDTGWTEDGWLVKFDEEGNQQWEINNEVQTTHNHYYSVVQLPQGGYIACGMYGGDGYLARYAPETGISQPDPVSSLSLGVSPNPCSSALSVVFSLPEAGTASVHIYDLNGRRVSSVVNSQFPAGSNTVIWTPSEELSSGCYIIRLNAGLENITENFVLIR